MTRDSDPADFAAGDADDDALSWAGEDDPTLTSSSQPSSLAPGWTVVGEPGAVIDEQPTADSDDGIEPALLDESSDDASTDAAAASSTMLIVLGVLGGVYMLYTVGWIIAAGRVTSASTDVVGSFMFNLGLWLAAAAPALWFGLCLWFTPAAPRKRLLWLVLGVVLLVPVPFVVGVGVGA